MDKVSRKGSRNHVPPQDLRLAFPPNSARPPKTPPTSKTAKALPSEEALADADEFRRLLLPDDFSPGAGWRIAWARALDSLVAEGRTLDAIWEVCRWARKDSFWSAHFHVPTELLKRKAGVLVFDRLRSAMNSGVKKSVTEPRM